MNFAGRDIAGTVQRNQIMAIYENELFQFFTALEKAENITIQGPQIVWINRVQDGVPEGTDSMP